MCDDPVIKPCTQAYGDPRRSHQKYKDIRIDPGPINLAEECGKLFVARAVVRQDTEVFYVKNQHGSCRVRLTVSVFVFM
jgi:hypothetical protein